MDQDTLSSSKSVRTGRYDAAEFARIRGNPQGPELWRVRLRPKLELLTLVSVQIDDGKRLIDRLGEEDVPVSAAAWAKESDGGFWYLYLATPLVGPDQGTQPAYRYMIKVIGELQEKGFWIDPTSIKMIAPDDRVAQAIVVVRDRYRAMKPIWFRGQRLGELEIEEAYIYP